MRLETIDLGEVSYAAALELQRRLVEELAQAPRADRAYLLLAEHRPPVITLGRRARPDHVLASRESLGEKGIELHQTTRGGDVTYHGPGQLVGYPILKLSPPRLGLHAYLRGLEEALIAALDVFGIAATRRPGATGVWVGCDKIAAIGVALRRWVTWHGFALNVSVDMSHFGLIVPCGLRDTGVTDMSRTLGRPVAMADVKATVVQSFRHVFD